MQTNPKTIAKALAAMGAVSALGTLAFSQVSAKFRPKTDSAVGVLSGNSRFRDPNAIKSINTVHMKLESDIGSEMQKRGVSRAEFFFPVPSNNEHQDSTYTATVDGVPMKVVNDIYGRPMLTFIGTQSTGKAIIEIDVKLYQADKGAGYHPSVEVDLTPEEKKFYLRGNNDWFDHHSPEFQRVMREKGLVRGKEESPFEYAQRLVTYFNANSRYAQGIDNPAPGSQMLKNFTAGDCKDYSMLAINLFRANGIPAKANMCIVIFKGGESGFHNNVCYFDKAKGGWGHFDEAAHGGPESVGKDGYIRTSGRYTQITLGEDCDYEMKGKDGNNFRLGVFLMTFHGYGSDHSHLAASTPSVVHNF